MFLRSLNVSNKPRLLRKNEREPELSDGRLGWRNDVVRTSSEQSDWTMRKKKGLDRDSWVKDHAVEVGRDVDGSHSNQSMIYTCTSFIYRFPSFTVLSI